MKRSGVQGFVALLAGFAITAHPASATANDSPPPPYLDLPQTTACIDAMVTTGRANNMLSGVAATALLDGQVVYRRGFGTIAPTSTQPVLPTTRFRIGSVTKSMTATAVLSLVDEGAIKMSAPAAALLPGFSLPGAPGWSDRLNSEVLADNDAAHGMREGTLVYAPGAYDNAISRPDAGELGGAVGFLGSGRRRLTQLGEC